MRAKFFASQPLFLDHLIDIYVYVLSKLICNNKYTFNYFVIIVFENTTGCPLPKLGYSGSGYKPMYCYKTLCSKTHGELRN